MSLKVSPIRQISAIKGHPYYRSDYARTDIRIFLNGKLVDRPVFTADAINGYIRVLPTAGLFCPMTRIGTLVGIRVKGQVEIYEVANKHPGL